MNGSVFDLNKFKPTGKRVEISDPLGHIIADPNFKVEAGKYHDSMGVGHVCIALTDPQVEGGARRVYLLPKAGAQNLAEGLRKAAGEVSV